MFLYTVIEAVVAVISGILVARRTKRYSHVSYGFFDRVCQLTNLLLLALYVCLAPFYMFIGMICTPYQDGALGIAVCVLCASAALFCGLGLGFSVAFRKKGMTGMSFISQFAGVLGITLTVACYMLFEGTLIAPLNLY